MQKVIVFNTDGVSTFGRHNAAEAEWMKGFFVGDCTTPIPPHTLPRFSALFVTNTLPLPFLPAATASFAQPRRAIEVIGVRRRRQ